MGNDGSRGTSYREFIGTVHDPESAVPSVKGNARSLFLSTKRKSCESQSLHCLLIRIVLFIREDLAVSSLGLS